MWCWGQWCALKGAGFNNPKRRRRIEAENFTLWTLQAFCRPKKFRSNTYGYRRIRVVNLQTLVKISMGQVASRDTIREWRGHLPTFRPVPTNNVRSKCSRFAQRWIGRARGNGKGWRGLGHFCHREKDNHANVLFWVSHMFLIRVWNILGNILTRADGRRGIWIDKQAGRLTYRRTDRNTDTDKRTDG